MDSEAKEGTLTFDVQGEFITQLAREWLCGGEKSFDEIIEILMQCMMNDDIPKAQTRRYAEDILIGRAALKGSTRAGTYHLEVYEPGEEEPLPESMNFWKTAEKKIQAEKELKETTERLNTVMNFLPEEMKRQIRREMGEETEEDRQFEKLDSYVKRTKDEKKHTTADYGWLSPHGKFYGVEWGDHEDWANNFLEEKGLENNDGGNTLIKGGWVLLHNPAHGIAFPTRSAARSYTKAQKEFLYDYYMERDCKKEANEVWEE